MKTLILVLALLCSGCATIMNSDTVNVAVTTKPPEAKLAVAGAHYTSPATVIVPRGKGDFLLLIEKDPYPSREVYLRQGISGWYWGNLIFGGLIGFIMDPITGRWRNIEPTELYYDFDQAVLMPRPDAAPEEIEAMKMLQDESRILFKQPPPLTPSTKADSPP